MRRTICFALFGLLVSNGAAFPQAPLARIRGRVVVVQYEVRPAVFFRYGIPVHFPYHVWNFIAPVPTYALTPVPTYAFVLTGSASNPQLVFKDGTTYMVTDYWRVDDQLHSSRSKKAERSPCRTPCRSRTSMCNAQLTRMQRGAFGSF